MNKSIQQLVRCRICNMELTDHFRLSMHVKSAHHILVKTYYDTYHKTKDEGFCLICKKETRFKNIKHGYVKYCSSKCHGVNISDNAKNRNIKEVFDINIPEGIYLLGLLWADGNILPNNNLVNLEIMKTDYDDIAHIISLWNLFINHHHKKIMACCNVSNYQFHRLLENADYANKKIKTPKSILESIPNELQYYFWRGYFDGDGCFYYGKKYSCRQAVFTSSYEQDWTEHENILRELGINSFRVRRIITKRKKKNGEPCKYSRIVITDKSAIKKFGDYIYQGKQFGLTRKFQKFCAMYTT